MGTRRKAPLRTEEDPRPLSPPGSSAPRLPWQAERGATAAQLRFQASINTEPSYDNVIVEAHTVGQDTWACDAPDIAARRPQGGLGQLLISARLIRRTRFAASRDQGSVKVTWAFERRDVADVLDEVHSDVGEEVVEPVSSAPGGHLSRPRDRPGSRLTDKLAGHHYGAGWSRNQTTVARMASWSGVARHPKVCSNLALSTSHGRSD